MINPTTAKALGLVVALTAVLAASHGEPSQKVHRVGLLMQTTAGAASHITAAFAQTLRELGHVEGRNVVFEYRWAEGDADRFPALASELVRLKVDAIVASALPAAEAARRVTTTIPIIMVNVADPVASGLVQSLATPGGNVTGLSAQLTPEIRAKQLQLMKEALPGLARIAVLRRAELAASVVWQDYETAGRALDLKVQFFDVKSMDDVERAFRVIGLEKAGALLVPGDPLFFTHRERLVALATEHRLPGMFSTREFTDAGGLMSYSARLSDQFRRAAVYVDKILRGASPANLPVEYPSQFELVVNLKTARALKLAIPQPFLIRADQVVQ